MTDAAPESESYSVALKRMAISLVREARFTSNTGDRIAAIVTILALFTVGPALYGVYGLVLASAAGVALGAAAVLSRSDRPEVQVVTGAVCVAGALALAGLVLLTWGAVSTSASLGFVGLLAAFGMLLAATGAALSLSPSDRVSFVSVARVSWLTASGFLLAWTTVAAPRAGSRAALEDIAGEVVSAAVSLAISPEPGDAVFGFFVFLAVSSFVVATAVSRVSVGRLTSEAGGDLSRTAARTSNYLFALFLFASSAAVVSGLGSSSALEGVGEAGVPPMHLESLSTGALGGVIAAVVTSTVVRWILAVVFLSGSMTLAASELYSWLRDGFLRRFAYRKAVVGVGFVTGFVVGSVSVAVGLAGRALDGLISGGGPEALADVGAFGAVNIAFAAALLLLLVVSLFYEAVRLAVASSGWTAPAFASSGLFLTGVAAVLVDLYVAGLLAVAASMYVWDVGRYAAVLDASMPSDAPRQAVERVHAAGGLLLTLASLAAAVTVYYVAPLVAPSDTLVAVFGLAAAASVVYISMKKAESGV